MDNINSQYKFTKNINDAPDELYDRVETNYINGEVILDIFGLDGRCI